MATGTTAELLAMSGNRNPYPGKRGVVEEGALADLLLVDVNPTADINLVEDPAKSFAVIMKDGKVYRTRYSVDAAGRSLCIDVDRGWKSKFGAKDVPTCYCARLASEPLIPTYNHNRPLVSLVALTRNSCVQH